MDPQMSAQPLQADPDPYPNFRWLREHDPVSLVAEDESSCTYLVTNFADVRAALTDVRLDADGIERDTEVIGADPAEHTRLRKIMSGLLPNTLVRRYRPRIAEICHATLDAFAARGHADLMAEYAIRVPVAVIHELVGFPAELQEPPEVCMRHFYLASFALRRDPSSMAFIDDYLRRIVEYKRGAPGDDMTTELLAALGRGDLRDEREVRTILYSVIGGGHVSTGPFIAAAALRLMENPEQLADVLADPELWPAVVEESLRYDSPLQFARNRYATAGARVGGCPMAEGDRALLALAAANRDPEVYPDPERFDLHRPVVPHLAFGQGTHYCPGSQLARAEGQIALKILFDRLPDLRLAGDDPIRWTYGPALRGPVAVPVTFTPEPAA